jgi:integrase
MKGYPRKLLYCGRSSRCTPIRRAFAGTTRPIGRWKEAWEAAKIRAKVQCRFHDLRHTGCTRMLEAGAPFPLIARIMGWSTATTVRMAKRYGHIGTAALRSAVESISVPKAAPKSEESEERKPEGSFDNPFALNSKGDDEVCN